jgi:hypothetical protein
LFPNFWKQSKNDTKLKQGGEKKEIKRCWGVNELMKDEQQEMPRSMRISTTATDNDNITSYQITSHQKKIPLFFLVITSLAPFHSHNTTVRKKRQQINDTQRI